MGSLRWTLTLWFTAALAAALLVFGVTMGALQRRASREALDERLSNTANLIAGLLAAEQRASSQPLIEELTNPEVERSIRLQAILDSIPYWVLVVDSTSKSVYGSDELRRSRGL